MQLVGKRVVAANWPHKALNGLWIKAFIESLR